MQLTGFHKNNPGVPFVCPTNHDEHWFQDPGQIHSVPLCHWWFSSHHFRSVHVHVSIFFSFASCPLPFSPSCLSFCPTRAIFGSPRTVSHPIWPFLLSSPPKNTHLAAANVSSPCRTHARRQTRQTRSHLAPFSLTAPRLFCCMPVSDRVVFLGRCFAGSLAS